MTGRTIRRLAALLLALFSLLAAVRAELQPSPLLDSALSMLEQGNPFLLRYGKLRGEPLAARYPDGCPYFFGGRLARLIHYPRQAWQSSEHFKEGQWYIYGLDCYGFVGLAYQEGGLTPPRRISDSFDAALMGDRQIPLDSLPPERWPEALKPGDLLALRGSYNHIMIYIGTLKDYGYTAASAGDALAPYLHYPLFIQSGDNHRYIERYEAFIRNLGKNYTIHNTDGGVCVVIVGTPDGAAPFTADTGRLKLPYFQLEGYDLIAYSLARKDAFVGIRQR